MLVCARWDISDAAGWHTFVGVEEEVSRRLVAYGQRPHVSTHLCHQSAEASRAPPRYVKQT